MLLRHGEADIRAAFIAVCAAQSAPRTPHNPRFPDFSLLSFGGRMTEMITAVIITHFHLDHCAALPYFTEVSSDVCGQWALFSVHSKSTQVW